MPEEGRADELVGLSDEPLELLVEGEMRIELRAGWRAEQQVRCEGVGHQPSEGWQRRLGVNEEVAEPQDDIRLEGTPSTLSQ